MKIQAGTLNQRIDFLKQETTIVDGDYVTAWTAFLSAVPAQVRYLSGKEVLQSGENWQQMNIRITMREHDGINNNCRVIWKGKTLDVVYAYTDEDHTFTVMALEVTNGA